MATATHFDWRAVTADIDRRRRVGACGWQGAVTVTVVVVVVPSATRRRAAGAARAARVIPPCTSR